MSFFFFFKNRKPRAFEHKPIYFDPDKRKLTPESTAEAPELRRRGFNFVQGTSHLKKRMQARQRSTRSFFTIVCVGLLLLAAALYLYFFL